MFGQTEKEDHGMGNQLTHTYLETANKTVFVCVCAVECSLRCRYTMRGHTESVNAVQFLPYSNILITCSADKTVSMWDARTVSCSLFSHK